MVLRKKRYQNDLGKRRNAAEIDKKPKKDKNAKRSTQDHETRQKRVLSNNYVTEMLIHRLGMY